MKNFTVLVICIFLGITLFSQEEARDPKQIETLSHGEIESGVYGGVFVKIGDINDATGVFLGAQGGWIINHKLVIGIKGYGLVNNPGVNTAASLKLNFGCGGGFLEYMIAHRKLVNLSLHTIIGAGGVGYTGDNYFGPLPEIDYYGDGFFVLEPGANLNLNVSGNFKIGIGASYRLVSGVDYDTLSDPDLNGLSGEFILKFGSF